MSVKAASRTRSPVGRVDAPRGAKMRWPFRLPAMIRTRPILPDVRTRTRLCSSGRGRCLTSGLDVCLAEHAVHLRVERPLDVDEVAGDGSGALEQRPIGAEA